MQASRRFDTHARRRRRVRTRLAVATVLGLALSVLPLAGHANGSLTATPLRLIGKPGYAALYAWGVATAADGTLLVGNYWNDRVDRYSTNGQFLGTVVPAHPTDRRAKHGVPSGIGVDPVDGDFYVGDVNDGCSVEKYDPSGTFLLRLGNCTEDNPERVAVGPDERVYVPDKNLDQISVFDASGNYLFAFHSAAPRGLDFDSQGNLYVIDNTDELVNVFAAPITASSTPSYTFSLTATDAQPSAAEDGSSGCKSGPDFRGLAIDRTNGWLYVVNINSGFIGKYDLSGQFVTNLGGMGSGPGQFSAGGREVTVDHSSDVWVADMPDFQMQEFSSSGSFVQAVPNPPAPPPPGGFNNPTAVSLDASGDIFVLDTLNQRVEEFAPDGDFLSQWGSRGFSAASLAYPRGLAIDPADGSVVIADHNNDAVKKFTPSGSVIWARTLCKGFFLPQGVAVDGSGTIYVADAGRGRVRVFSPSGTLIQGFGTRGTAPGDFEYPWGVAVDTDGSLWVADHTRDVVVHLSSTGAFLGEVGSPGTEPDQLMGPIGVALYQGYLLVADAPSDLVKVFNKSDGSFVMSFGGNTGRQLGSLSGPAGLDVQPDGTLYVTELGHERVTEFQLTTN